MTLKELKIEYDRLEDVLKVLNYVPGTTTQNPIIRTALKKQLALLEEMRKIHLQEHTNVIVFPLSRLVKVTL